MQADTFSFKIVVAALRRHFWLLARYSIAGLIGTSVQTLSLYTYVTVLGYQGTYLVGAGIAFVLALTLTFTLQKFWTFRDHALHRAKEQFYFYTAVAVVNLTLNLGLLAFAKEVATYAGLDFFSGWYVIAQIAISLCAAAVSFALNFLFTFRHARPSLSESSA